MHRIFTATVGILTSLLLPSAQAANLRWGGFVTVNYAISDIDNSYQRFIDNEGTVKAGTVAGLQADVEFTPSVKGAIQVTANPKTDSDTGTDLQVKWAFLRWHPASDWSISVGRLRAGLYADAQNLEVGSTYAPVFLPTEVYFNEQYIRYDGLNIQYRTAVADDADISVELFGGVNQDTNLRVFSPQSNRALFFGTEQRTRGLRVAYHRDNIMWFGTYLNGEILDGNKPRAFQIDFDALTTGFQWKLSQGWQVDFDVLHTKSKLVGRPSTRYTGVGSVVSRRMGAWMPFVSASAYESSRSSTGVKPSQYTIKGGTAFDWSAAVRVKTELGHVSVGDASGQIDGPFSNRAFSYLALSYNLIY